MNSPTSQFLLVIGGMFFLLHLGTATALEKQDGLGDPLPPDALARVGTNRPQETIPADFPQVDSLRGAALSADGKVLATYGEPADPKSGQLIQIWEAQTGKHLRDLDGHESPIRALALAPDGETLVSSSFDSSEGTGLTRIWDVASGKSRHIIPGGGTFLRFLPDGRSFWLVVRDRLLVYRADTGQEIRRVIGPTIVMDISRDARYALGISHTRDSVLRMYDLSNNREILKLEGTSEAPRMARFSPDGRTVAVIDHGKNISVWEVASGRLVHELPGDNLRVFSLEFSPDGQFLVSGGLDRSIRAWELATGQEVEQFTGHTKAVTVLSFSETGRQLVSGSTDRTALVWDARPLLISRLQVPPFNDQSLKTLWEDLLAATPSRAYRAMGTIVADEQGTLPYLQEQIEGLLIPSKNNRIEQLLKELDDEDSLVRHRATRELRKFRQLAQPILLKVIKETRSPEVRARLRYILTGADNTPRFTAADQLRMLRVIQLAEQLDSPASQSLLELLADECPLPIVVKEAQRVLEKLRSGGR